jgi:tetratricopeptide (TPR) repeat protein
MLGLFVLMLAACTQNPRSAEAEDAHDSGEAYCGKGQYNEAIIEFRNALQVDPDFVPALHALGRAYEWALLVLRRVARADAGRQKLAPHSVPDRRPTWAKCFSSSARG